MSLSKVLQAAGRPRAVVAFDLDSTLLDNRPRSARIFREFAKKHGGDASGLAQTMPQVFRSWDLVQAMVEVGIPVDRAQRLKPALVEFWRPRFFSGDYCLEDIPIEGATDFVHAVAQAGAHVAYVTGRHEEMRQGTLESFHRHGFPLPNGKVELVMKPNIEMQDDSFKVEAHARLRQLGETVAAFDNEPTHINGYAESFPRAILMHLATDHSGRPVALHPQVRSIPHFRFR